MKINDRLKKIGDLVEANSFCLDVGCDHALLDIYLVKKNEKESLDNLKDTIKDSIVTDKLQNDQNLKVTTWDKIRSKYNLNIADTKLKNTYESTVENAKVENAQ